MKYLVESYIGGFYICDDDPKIIEKPNRNGEHNVIVFAFEGDFIRHLRIYFSKMFLTREELLLIINKYSEQEIIEIINYRYELNRVMLDCLVGNKLVSIEEKSRLLQIILNSQKENIMLFNSVIYDKRYNSGILAKKIKRKNK